MIERLGRRKDEARKGLELARGEELTDLVEQREAAEDAVRLGAIAAVLARAGADKLTLLLGPQLEPAGPRIAELIGEQTHGRVVPVVGEPLGRQDRYGVDRLFVSIALQSEAQDAASLANAGHPLLQRTLADASEIEGELLCWAGAARVMARLLEVEEADSPVHLAAMAQDEPALRAHGLSLFAPHAAMLRKAAGTLGERVAASPAGWIAAHLALADAGDFSALIGEVADARAIQGAIRDATRLACTAGRDLRAAGHLEGARGGHFLLLGEQTRDDFGVLIARGRVALRIRADDSPPGVIFESLQAAAKMISR